MTSTVPNCHSLVAVSVYLSVTIAFFLLACAFLDGAKRTALVTCNSAAVICVIICCYVTTTINTDAIGDEERNDCLCTRTRKPITRYCASCKKQTYGLDHHCVWLNKCIGAKNYTAFRVLISACLVQMVLQTLVGVLLQIDWKNHDRIQR